jgi:hypothetical protein
VAGQIQGAAGDALSVTFTIHVIFYATFLKGNIYLQFILGIAVVVCINGTIDVTDGP